MTKLDVSALEKTLRALPQFYRGPGGVAGVVKDGEVILRHAWGFADLDARLPMAATTRMPICSISKQFTCAVLLDLVGDPAKLDGEMQKHLPLMEGERPSVADLCNNQSGLRDYWALTVLHGAAADGVFRREDAKTLFSRMRTTHFAPGSRYSYSNGNFRLLCDLIEDHAGKPLGELYAERIFEPAGMSTAALMADTASPPDGIVGYEGNMSVGYFPATNRIYWAGDAGICASLDDMLAWERYIDRTREDADGLYRRLCAPQPFADGTPSKYGFGLAQETFDGKAMSGHGGALRGFRCRRLYIPSERLSVVVMFNHQADAHGAAVSLVKAALGDAEQPVARGKVDPAWAGHYIDPETDLLLTVQPGCGSRLQLRFATSPETLTMGEDGIARSASTTLRLDGDTLLMERPGENLRVTATRLSGEARPDIAGRFHSAELDASLELVSTGEAIYGAFDGFLGKGAMQPVFPVSEDVWIMPCQRAMDAPAPGDWTIRVKRDGEGKVIGLRLGCWLARQIDYEIVA